jgi:hypothetical protein
MKTKTIIIECYADGSAVISYLYDGNPVGKPFSFSTLPKRIRVFLDRFPGQAYGFNPLKYTISDEEQSKFPIPIYGTIAGLVEKANILSRGMGIKSPVFPGFLDLIIDCHEHGTIDRDVVCKLLLIIDPSIDASSYFDSSSKN